MTRGDLEMLLVTLIWGVNAIMLKDALGAFLPLQFNAIRLSLAALMLLGVMAVSRKFEVPSKKDWPMVILAGFLGNTFYQILFIKGLALSTASNTSFVLATEPATTAVLAYFMGRQKMTARMWLGVFLTMVGVVGITLAGGRNGPGVDGVSVGVGDLITFVGTLGWCLFIIITTDMVKRMSPLAFTAWTMVAGAVLLVPFSIKELRASNWAQISPANWGELLFSAAFALVFSYILWNRGIQHSGPVKTAVYQNLIPVWTGIFGWFVLQETWSAGKFAGAMVILLGVHMVRVTGTGRAKTVARRE